MDLESSIKPLESQSITNSNCCSKWYNFKCTQFICTKTGANITGMIIGLILAITIMILIFLSNSGII